MSKKKVAIIITSVIAGSLALAIAIPFSVLGIRTASLKSEYAYLNNDEKYSVKAETTGVELVTQHISCGYASIEMVSAYYGDRVSEDQLSKKNGGGVSTSSSAGFLNEINASIPNKSFEKQSYLKNDQLLITIHDSLSKGNPVVIEWAALCEKEWTLHFSVVSGLDIGNDQVIVYNPYGYVEELSINEFLSRTTFESYSSMPFFLSFGFAFGAFEKNTVFYAKG